MYNILDLLLPKKKKDMIDSIQTDNLEHQEINFKEKNMVKDKEENTVSLGLNFGEVKESLDVFIKNYSNDFGRDEIPKFDVELKGDKTKIIIHYMDPLLTLPVVLGVSRITNEDLILRTSRHIDDLSLSSNYNSLFNDKPRDKFEIYFNEKTNFSSMEFNKIQEVSIEKNASFTQLELDNILEIYKIANPIITSKKDKKVSLEEKLSDFGVIVYNSNDEHTWDSIAGYDNVKEEILGSVIMTYKHPEIYDKIAQNTRINYENNKSNAILFEGPPGTGKTSLARVIAHEVDVPLVYVPIESIMTKWYGESERNLSQIFDICSEYGDGSILFLDEIDSLGLSRDSSGNEASRRVLSTLLRKMDGFNQNSKTLVLGATNRKNDLDSALFSRFDLSINVPLPNNEERISIYSLYAKHLNSDELKKIAEQSQGYSGRNIKDICEHAERNLALDIIKSGEEYISQTPDISYYLNSINYRE